jgi:amino acid transporter
MGVSYLLFAYATVTGFGYSEARLTSPSVLVPFITVAHGALASLAFFAYLAGLTSTLGVLIAAVNSQARLIFNAGREGLLPRWIGRVEPGRQVPRNAIFTFIGLATAIIGVWALGHLIFGHAGSMDGLTYFDESGTMGTLLVLIVYFLANLALPFYYRKYRPSEFSLIKHALLPVLGMIAIAVPVYYLSKPGQTAPYSWFPYAALAILIASLIYAAILTRRDPGLAHRVGSIVADE